MILIAYSAVILVLLCCGYGILASGLCLATGDRRWLHSAAHALNAAAAFLTLAVVFLLLFLFQRNFQLEYVANYTDVALSPLYVISALWAGQRGSLLVWAWLLALCGAIGVRRYQKQVTLARYGFAPEASIKTSLSEALWLFPGIAPEFPFLVGGIALVIGFFALLLAFAANPFRMLANPPFNGEGLSPLLQNPYMIIHPPVLFLGYACFLIPCVLAFASLMTGEIRREWLRAIRQWVLAGWFFLGIGILLGAHWAYLELGWGGYWSWDPVENSSLLPWLTSTALLHTLFLQRRKGVFVRLNLALTIITFALCILATFITRSGILQSVHAYAQSATGHYFFWFLALIAVGAITGFAGRWKTLRSPTASFALLSKESSLLLTTQLLLGLGFAVLYGTLYPIFSELFSGKHVMFQRSFFDTISLPLGLLLLALLGCCQWFSWEQGISDQNRRRLLFVGGLSLGSAAILGLAGLIHLATLLTCVLGLFGALSLLKEKEALFRPATFFHTGTVLIVVAIAISTTYKQELDVQLLPGESATLGNLRFEYVQLHFQEDQQKGTVAAEVKVYDQATLLTTLMPQQQFHGPSPEEAQVTTEVGWSPSLTRDVYVILAGWDEQEQAAFRFLLYPLIVWIWIGGCGMFTIGALLYVSRTSKIT